MAVNQRRRGHDWERELAIIFREFYPNCRTSREAYRLYDVAGVDLHNTGDFAVQAKVGVQAKTNYSTTLKNMRLKTYELFPNGKERFFKKVIIHKKNCQKGRQREEEDTLVVMSLDTFLSMIRRKKRKVK